MRPRGRGLTRRGLLGTTGAGLLGTALGGGAATAGAAVRDASGRKGRRNVLLITTSNTRADFIGAYDDSDELASTPNLDELARQSLRFKHAVAESMPTVPARRALLTGMRSFPFRDWRRSPDMPGEPGWNPIDESRQPIVTDVMRDSGVFTAYATDNPFLVGPQFANFRATVDRFEGQLSQASWREYNEPYTGRASSADLDRHLIPALRGTPEEARLRSYLAYNAESRRSERDYSAARVVRDGIGLLRRLKEGLADDEPFFLGVDLFDPSEPFDPPARYLERFDSLDRGVVPIQPFETPFSRVEDLGLDADAVKRVRQLYAAELSFVDAWIGRLLDELEELGLAESTLVIYLGDHGISLGERGIIGRSPDTPYEEVYRIPLMMRDPDGRRAGDESTFFASTHDVPRTLLSFLGVTPPGKMTGEDLTCLFDDERPPRRPWFTSGISTTLLCGNWDWLLVARDSGAKKLLYETEEDEGQEDDVLREWPRTQQKMWAATITAAGGTIPQFGDDAPVRPSPEIEDEDDLDNDGEPDTDEDSDLQDLQDQQQRGQTQGVSFDGEHRNWKIACTCGLVLTAMKLKDALADAEGHIERHHPELAGTMEPEELVRPEEEAAAAG